MSDPKEPYQIAPENAATPSPKPPPDPKSADLKAKLNLSGLLEDFEEDADFEKDPELEAKITGKPRAAAPVPDAPPRPEFITDGKVQPKHWAAAGGVLVLGAMVAAGINAPSHTVPWILLALYNAFIHTGTGVVALYAAARLLEMRFGHLEQGVSRMFVAVGVFVLLSNLRLAPFSADYGALNRGLTFLVAIAGYTITVASVFGLWNKQKLGFVIGFHALLWTLVVLGMELSGVISAPTKAG